MVHIITIKYEVALQNLICIFYKQQCCHEVYLLNDMVTQKLVHVSLFSYTWIYL